MNGDMKGCEFVQPAVARIGVAATAEGRRGRGVKRGGRCATLRVRIGGGVGEERRGGAMSSSNIHHEFLQPTAAEIIVKENSGFVDTTKMMSRERNDECDLSIPKPQDAAKAPKVRE